MRIKYLTNVRIPTGRAHGYAIMKMCSEFAKTGIKTELFVPTKSNNENKQDPFEFYGLDKNFEIKRVKSFDLLGKTLKFGGIFYWVDILSFLLGVKSKVNLESGDVLYTRDFVTPLFFSKKNKICLELHSIPKSKFIFKMAIKKVDSFVVLTNDIKRRLTDLGIDDKNILVSPSGVDSDEYKSGVSRKKIDSIEKGDFVYGYVGTLKTMGMEKGVKIGLEALKLLPKNFKFLIVGGSVEEIEEYRNIALKLGVSDRSIFVGLVPHSLVSAYIMNCDVLVAPFPENEHYSYFMSPLKIFEYMMSRKPIIATDLPSLRDVLINGQNSILVPPGDLSALVNAIVKIKDEPDFSKQIAQNAYNEVVEKYTWKKRVENIIKFVSQTNSKN